MFVEAEKYNRRFCFILGSGASRAAGIKTGVEMAKQWATELEEKYERKELKNLMDKLHIDSIVPNSQNYFGIYDLRYYPDYHEGYAYFERELEKGSPSLGHYALAKILAGKKHNLAITTNFDSLVEDALFIYTNKHPLVVGHESLTQFINLNIERPIIAKIHRSLYFRPFNRKEETMDLADGWKETLRNAFNVYTPVVVGYAGGDESLMKFLQDEHLKMNGLYWCYWNKEKPSEEIVELVKSKNGCMVPIEGFDLMMFMLSRKLGLDNPEKEMLAVTNERIQNYNKQYREFEKDIREKYEKAEATDESMQETIKEIGDFNVALFEAVNQKLEKEKTPENYVERGEAYFRLNEFDNAISDFNEAINLKPDFAEAYVGRGNVYCYQGKYDCAIKDFDEAIRLNPTIESYNCRARTYYMKDEYDFVIRDCDEAIRIKANANSFYYRGRAYFYKEEYELAMRDYNEAIRLDSNDSITYWARGDLYYEKGEYDLAIKDYNESIRLSPDWDLSYQSRGEAYFQKGKYDLALKDYQEALRISPESLLAQVGIDKITAKMKS
ncbi:MAG: tetratricopeptide repeat protein [Lachnospiraceae bacterium]|nr:tetratricopeptide repeat protein [Lachnospiraceae bacterium]